MEEKQSKGKKGAGITLMILGICIIAAGLVVFTINFGATAFDMFSPVLGIALFMIGAVMTGIGSALAFAKKVKGGIEQATGDMGFFDVFEKSAELANKKIEQETLETEAEIAKLEKKNQHSRKCANCGASKKDVKGKCPYCGS